jgi:ISXO2-like transposase domain/Transposase zinc-ribbon domain
MVAENTTPSTLLAALRHFDPDTADAYVRSIKWPDGPCCPKCGSVRVGEIKSRRRFQCRERECRHQFSLIADTIFAGTHLRLDQWIAGVWMIVNCRNGVSSCEIARAIGCKQQSAWHLLHRVRYVIQQAHAGQMHGEIESDESFVGGLLKFMTGERKERARARGKAIVHALKERSSGTVRAEVLPAARTEFVRDAVLENVAENAILYTDESHLYDWADGVYIHESVNHQERYVDGRCHTNGLECFFNTLRRGLKGTYIRATPGHLQAYVDEQVYRFNHRHLTDWERFDGAMRLIVGKRLTYSELTGGAVR